MSTITIMCPNCGNEMVVTESCVGKETVCRTCKHKFWVKKSLVVNNAARGFDKFIRYAAYIGGGIFVFLWFLLRAMRNAGYFN